ncbi:MAG: tagaturonate epimerase family protein [Phycisphaerae bacterium]
MNAITRLLDGAPLSVALQERAATELGGTCGFAVYPASVESTGTIVLALGKEARRRRLILACRTGNLGAFGSLSPEHRKTVGNVQVAVVSASPAAASMLREAVPWTSPRLCGLATSIGLGDRLGLATPGHILAVRDRGCAPFLAQQSIREMTRTQRTPQEVMDDAVWGVFQAGWRGGFGSDADHLKTTADIDATAAAGFTMFTIDPGEHVCSEADTMTAAAASMAADTLPWADLETNKEDLRKRYLDRRFPLAGRGDVRFTEETLLRAAVKYGRAIAHTAAMYRHLVARLGIGRFELEVSVDETDAPTSEAEHYLVAAELKRLGVRWVSLAPRFIGAFEKGVDYRGDLEAFEQSYAVHAAIARTLGPYKLSLHSGSDKFSVYPIAARLSEGLVHLKTAGTSYLEALRVIARVNPDLFRRIVDFAHERFDTDKASYHISARIERVPRPNDLKDAELECILDSDDGRQLLHVTYGSVLTATDADGIHLFRRELLETLIDHEEEHHAVLAEHMRKHLEPFALR